MFQDRKCVNVYDLPWGLGCILTFQATIPLIKSCTILHQRSTGCTYIRPVFCPETASISALMDLEFSFFISGSVGLRNLTPSSIYLSIPFSGLLLCCALPHIPISVLELHSFAIKFWAGVCSRFSSSPAVFQFLLRSQALCP